MGFMPRRGEAGRPSFLYLPLTQLHFPTLPHRDFAGRTGYGDFADAMVELDHRVGQIDDAIAALGIADDTLLVFASDNGPEFRPPYRGTAGYWRGTYHTAMEGSLRVPFLARWPSRIAAGRVSDEIVHVTDVFATLASIAGASLPADRPIDGVDQTAFLLGESEASAREGFLYFIKTQLRAVKWRDWKMHLVWEVEPNDGAKELESPYLFHLKRDPKEESNVLVENTWVIGPMRRMMLAFQHSAARHPHTPPGAPDPT